MSTNDFLRDIEDRGTGMGILERSKRILGDIPFKSIASSVCSILLAASIAVGYSGCGNSSNHIEDQANVKTNKPITVEYCRETDGWKAELNEAIKNLKENNEAFFFRDPNITADRDYETAVANFDSYYSLGKNGGKEMFCGTGSATLAVLAVSHINPEDGHKTNVEDVILPIPKSIHPRLWNIIVSSEKSEPMPDANLVQQNQGGGNQKTR